MIGLCQEAKSSPDALREERGCKFFSAFSASCWPLGDGFYSRIEPDFHLLAQLVRLPRRLSLCFPAKVENSLRLCLARLKIRWFDLVAEASELPDHPRSASSLRPLADGGAA